MSGGHFDYKQFYIQDIVGDIDKVIKEEKSTKKDECGYPISKGFSENTIKEFVRAKEVLGKAAIYARRIDWLLSGDDGEESFHERLEKELKNATRNTETR